MGFVEKGLCGRMLVPSAEWINESEDSRGGGGKVQSTHKAFWLSLAAEQCGPGCEAVGLTNGR